MQQRPVQAWFSKAFNWPVLEKSRWHWIDYLRGIAIILVVFRHILFGILHAGVDAPILLQKANTISSSFRMPLFFVLSGIFVKSSMAKRTLKQILGIKFENLFYPYLIWSVIQITIQILVSGSTYSQRSWIDYTYILYQPRDLDQFWYLPALFNASAVYMIVESKLKPGPWVHIALGLALYFLSHYFQAVSMMSDWMRFYVFLSLGAVVSEFFFKESTQHFLKNPWSLLLVTPLFVLAEIAFLRKDENFFLDDNDMGGRIEYLLIALTGCISLLIFSFRLQVLNWKGLAFLRVIGYHSLYIYVMHVIVAAGARAVLMKAFHIHELWILLPVEVALGVIVPIMFYNLLINEGPLWFLFSYHKHKKEPKPAPIPVKTKALAS
jgi:fucose 4-O-acetylase-like acetyltransferase